MALRLHRDRAGHLPVPASELAARPRGGPARCPGPRARLRRPPRARRAPRDAGVVPGASARRSRGAGPDGRDPGVQPGPGPAVSRARRPRRPDDRHGESVAREPVADRASRGACSWSGSRWTGTAHGSTSWTGSARMRSWSRRPTSTPAGRSWDRSAAQPWSPGHATATGDPRGRLRRGEPLRPTPGRGAPGAGSRARRSTPGRCPRCSLRACGWAG